MSMNRMDTAPKDEFRGPDFIALIQDDGGRWQDICCWSGLYQMFLPRTCLANKTRWEVMCEETNTRIVGWWPMPEMPDAVED